MTQIFADDSLANPAKRAKPFVPPSAGFSGIICENLRHLRIKKYSAGAAANAGSEKKRPAGEAPAGHQFRGE
jgi:hypothetical protein